MAALACLVCLLLTSTAFGQSIPTGQCKKEGLAYYTFQASTISSELAIKPSLRNPTSLDTIDASDSYPFFLLMRFYECSDGTFRYTLNNLKSDPVCGNNCLLEKSSSSLKLAEVSETSPDLLERSSPYLFEYTTGLSIVESTVGHEGTYLKFNEHNQISFDFAGSIIPVWWSLPVAQKADSSVYLDPLGASYCGDDNKVVSSAVDCEEYFVSIDVVQSSKSAGVEVVTIINRANSRRKRSYGGNRHTAPSYSSRTTRHRSRSRNSRSRNPHSRNSRSRGHYRGPTMTKRPIIDGQRDRVQEFLVKLCARYAPGSQLFRLFNCEEIRVTTTTTRTTTPDPLISTVSSNNNQTDPPRTRLNFHRMHIYDKPVINVTNETQFFTPHEAALIKIPDTELYLTTGSIDIAELATPDLTLFGIDGAAIPTFNVKFSAYPETRTRIRATCNVLPCPFAEPSRSGVPLSEQTHVDERFFKVLRQGGTTKIRLESVIRPGFFLGFNTRNPNIPLVLAQQQLSVGIVFDLDENSFIEPALDDLRPPPPLQVPVPRLNGEGESGIIPQ